MPSAVIPRQLFWWRQALCFNKLVNPPITSLHGTVLLDNVWGASAQRVHSIAGSVASLLQPLGFHLGYIYSEVPDLNDPTVSKAAHHCNSNCSLYLQ